MSIRISEINSDYAECSSRKEWVFKDRHGSNSTYRYFSKETSAGFERICKIRIDCGVVKENSKKCDFAMELLDCNKIYFIELKGCDLKHAIKQLKETLDHFKGYLGEYSVVNTRAVVSGVRAPKIISTQVASLKILCARQNGTFAYKTNEMRENANHIL